MDWDERGRKGLEKPEQTPGESGGRSGGPGVLQATGSQRVGYNLATEQQQQKPSARAELRCSHNTEALVSGARRDAAAQEERPARSPRRSEPFLQGILNRPHCGPGL